MCERKYRLVYVISRHVNLKKLANPRYPANPKTFGQKLRKWRMDNNLTIKTIAKTIGADEMSIINWEIRNVTPVYKFARKIKELTGISPDSGFRDQRKSKPAPGSPGEQMRKKRQELGLSQVEMAEKLGVSVDYIADLETGRYRGKHKVRINSILLSF
ncbi:MAG: helix-turn-helix domain-containing protein [Candidatus Omnitrophota bacterium]